MTRRIPGLGSLVMALKPGDGSAREQAASCQRVLGGAANLAAEYATKRYRSNVVNWGMLPFIAEDVKDWNLQPGDRIYLPGIPRRRGRRGGGGIGRPPPERHGAARHPQASRHDPRGAGHRAGGLPDQLLRQVGAACGRPP